MERTHITGAYTDGSVKFLSIQPHCSTEVSDYQPLYTVLLIDLFNQFKIKNLLKIIT